MSRLSARESNNKRTKQIIKQVPEGYLLTENNSNQSIVFNLIFNFAKTFFILALVGQFISVLGRSPIVNLFAARLLIVFVVACLLAWLYNWSKSIYTAIDQVLVSLSFAPSELIFTNYPLSLGEEVSLIFRRRLRSGKIIREAGIVNANLVCLEDVIYDEDDGYAYATEKVIEQQLPEVLFPAYESAIEVIFKFKIPPTAPPTFEAKNNQINWILDVSLDFPKLLKENSKFCLQVQPQVFLAK